MSKGGRGRGTLLFFFFFLFLAFFFEEVFSADTCSIAKQQQHRERKQGKGVTQHIAIEHARKTYTNTTCKPQTKERKKHSGEYISSTEQKGQRATLHKRDKLSKNIYIYI
ncbi:MAG: hypothetical protein JOS17DRAFT_591679 [Linnemannia elongata]|nr:MAG: hypothetical protein JOS17DRAFT_591679 [Linnemannia elongata]